MQSPHIIFDIVDISIASSYDLYNNPREVEPKMLPMFTTKGVFNAQSNDRRRRRLALRRPLFALKIAGVCVASARFRGF